MVIEDITTPIQEVPIVEEIQNVWRIANPLDRIGAFVVDFFIIFLPVVSLFLAPLRSELSHLVFTEAYVELIVLFTEASAFIFMSFLLYQGYFLSVHGCTPGKRVFKLQVINFHSENKISFLAAVMRTSLIAFQMALFFVPFLSLLSAKYTRGLHDRIVGTVVVTDREDYKFPHPFELSFVRGMYSSFIFLFVLLFIIPILSTPDIIDFKSKGVSASKQPCDKVKDSFDLETYALMKVTGSLEANCNPNEVNSALLDKSSRDLAYFVKYLEAKGVGEHSLKKQYSNRLCYKSNELCEISRLDLAGTFPDYVKNGYVKNKVFKNWLFTKAMRLEKFEVVSRLMKNPKHMFEGKYFHQAAVKTSIARGEWGKAETKLKELASKSESDHFDLMAWSCFQGVSQTCERAKDFSCETFKNTYQDQPFVDSLAEVAYVQVSECNVDKENKVDYGVVHKNIASTKAKTYVYALGLVQRNEVKRATDVLRPMLFDNKVPIVLKTAVASKLLSIDPSGEFVSAVFKWWQKSPTSLAWYKVGSKMLKSQVERGAYEHALKVSSLMVGYKDLSDDDGRHAVIANYKAGNKSEAWSLAKKMKALDRAPASVSHAYSIVIKSLKKEFRR